MPYINESARKNLDETIDQMVKTLNKQLFFPDDPRSFQSLLGDINYCFSRVLGQLMGQASYPKIAMITGVLENIKQEFYRRVASSYEDQKIRENGDIREYKP